MVILEKMLIRAKAEMKRLIKLHMFLSPVQCKIQVSTTSNCETEKE
jgi:hypothetical protein